MQKQQQQHPSLVLGDVVDVAANVVASVIELACVAVIPINVATACINDVIVDAVAMLFLFNTCRRGQARMADFATVRLR